MSLKDIRINTSLGRLISAGPVMVSLAVSALATSFEVNLSASFGLDAGIAILLAGIAGYGFMIWRLTMNEHRAQQDELF